MYALLPICICLKREHSMILSRALSELQVRRWVKLCQFCFLNRVSGLFVNYINWWVVCDSVFNKLRPNCSCHSVWIETSHRFAQFRQNWSPVYLLVAMSNCVTMSFKKMLLVNLCSVWNRLHLKGSKKLSLNIIPI